MPPAPRDASPRPATPSSTAAERTFAERGFAAVSVREIAADAGLRNQASLYHHFRDKRALYEAVLARGLEPILGSAGRERRSHRDATATARPFVDRLVVYLAEHPTCRA